MNEDNIIKFDLNKLRTKEQERKVKDVKAKVGTFYKDWKKKICSAPRTRQELVTSLYDLQNGLGEILKESGLKEFEDYTINLLEDKIAETIAFQLAEKSIFVPYVPEGAKGDFKPIPFDSEEEFMKIPFVATIAGKEGFIGFLRNGNMIESLWVTGELLAVGSVTTTKCLQKFPTVEEMKLSTAEVNPAPSESGTDSTIPDSPASSNP